MDRSHTRPNHLDGVSLCTSAGTATELVVPTATSSSLTLLLVIQTSFKL